MVREEATRDVEKSYGLLLADINLTKDEHDALISTLVEDRISRTTTPYRRGKPQAEHERLKKIADIVGPPRLEQFLALERNLWAYAEVQAVGSDLRLNRVPLTETQEDRLLKMLIETRELYKPTAPQKTTHGSLQRLEERLIEQNEYERHVLELAVSVLRTRQLQLLSEHYQYRSEQRTKALEMQEKVRATNPGEDSILWYPAR